jgi:hypothetical protein
MSDMVELPPEVHALLQATARHPEAVFAGGMRMTGIQLSDGGVMVEPKMILWLDQTTGMIRAQRLINPEFRGGGNVLEAIDCLLDACLAPSQDFADEPTPFQRRGRQPGGEEQAFLPGKVVVTDEALARAARDTLGPYGVRVERVAALPDLDQVFDALLSMGRLMFDAAPGGPFTWEITDDLARQLFRAAAAYWRQAPWDYILDHPPLAVALGPHGPEEGHAILYASVLGSAGEVFGISLHYSLEDYQRAQQTGTDLAQRDVAVDEMLNILRQAGIPPDAVSGEEIETLMQTMLAGDTSASGQGPGLTGVENTLAMWLTPADETEPAYLDWIKRHGIRLFSREAVPIFVKVDAQGQATNPNERETRALAYALEALGHYFHRYHRLLDSPFYEPNRCLGDEFSVGPKVAHDRQAMVTVTFPAEGYEWSARDREDWLLNHSEDEEDAAEPPTEEGRKTLYVFKAALEADPAVWRRIEIRGDQSLGDLHAVLQRAFRWDNDHLYAFFLSGKHWDPRAEYDDPRGEEGRDASRHLLEHLALKRGRKIAYVFDFGDEWWVTLRLEKIVPQGVNARRKYPRIAEKEGRAPQQYIMWD